MSVEETRRAAGDLNRMFIADLEALPTEAWGRPSDCEGWSVASVLVHQAQVAELVADSLARGAAGDAGPHPRALDGVQAWRAWRTGEMARRVARPPKDIIAEYRASVAEMDRQLDAIAAAPPEARAWHPAGPQPLAWFAGQWLFELALHDWDIRVASDPSAEPRPAALSQFAETLPPRLARSMGPIDDPAMDGRYRIELARASGGPFVWQAHVAGGSVETSVSPEGDGADVTLRSDPAAFGLVMTNRRPVEGFAAANRWRAEGDQTRAAAFARSFKSY